MMDTKNWLSGLTIGEYVAQMDSFQKEMKVRLRDTRITQSECQRVRSLDRPLKIAVLTEAWCLDSLMNLPLLVKMADCSEQIEIRIFIRDQFLDLSEKVEHAGYDKIPLFIIMNQDFQIINFWMERPKSAYRLLSEWKEKNPRFLGLAAEIKNDPEGDLSEFKLLQAQLVDEMWNWYDTALQSETLKEILAAINQSPEIYPGKQNGSVK